MEKNELGVYTLSDEEITNLAWFKSEQSGPNCDNCVEVAFVGDPVTKAIAVIALRNSRDPDGPILTFDLGEWGAFIGGAHTGEFDAPLAA
ncbi:MAG TPA: DUF397 domain-containing protein [Candidatus Saccharimonadales bacterium]|nr:DUF397 domain-containing protein [Candidatus Saccharimonadales bacterium]